MATKTTPKKKTTAPKKKTTTTKPAKKTIKKTTKKAAKTPAWEIALSVISPTINRPRRTSLHTLAAVIGHKNPLKLAKEMQKSGKVAGYICPDVGTPIFYLDKFSTHPGMIDDRDPKVWGKWTKWDKQDYGAGSLTEFFKIHPYPKVKGFKRFANEKKIGVDKWGYPIYKAESAMTIPYEPSDYTYANEVIKALKTAGYKPGIKPYTGKKVAKKQGAIY